MQDLKDKVAVVTGGASGIGRGIARALAHEGSQVVVADVELSPAEEVAEELTGLGVRSLAVVCDVTDRASVEALAQRAFAEFGRVDLLCNNAGVGQAGPIAEAKVEDLEWVFAVNVFGVWNGCSAFVPRFKAQGSPAHILNTGSEHSIGVPSKHAVLGLSDVLRRELAPFGIGVTILCPAAVKTEIWNAGRNRPERFGGPLRSPEAFRNFLAAGMDPDAVGRVAVSAIRRGDFYALSHPEIRKLVEERYAELLAAFDAPAQSGIA